MPRVARTQLLSWEETLNSFAAHLGHHAGAHPDGLTLPELGALIITTGKAAGFLGHTEDPCGTGRIDCAWYSPDREGEAGSLIVAWEFDARDVDRYHLAGAIRRGKRKLGTFEKLRSSGAPIRIQVLYSIRRGIKRERSFMATEVFTQLLAAEPRIQLHTDSQLIQGDLESITRRALSHLRDVPND